VGWAHDQSSIFSPNFIPIWWYADNYRGYYRFDLSSVMGHYLIGATLKITVHSGDTGCLSGIAAADTDWTNTGGFIGGSFSPPAGDFNSGFDVKDIVRSWINGAPNYGFVLRGSNENRVAESTRCVTDTEPSAELDIVHR
jgi:hypothetical protein